MHQLALSSHQCIPCPLLCTQHSLFYVGGAQSWWVGLGSEVNDLRLRWGYGQRSTGWRLRCTDCCKVVPELLHALYSGTLLREVKGQMQLVQKACGVLLFCF